MVLLPLYPVFLNGSFICRTAEDYSILPAGMEWLSPLGTFPKVGFPNFQGLNLWDLQEGNRKGEKVKSKSGSTYPGKSILTVEDFRNHRSGAARGLRGGERHSN